MSYRKLRPLPLDHIYLWLCAPLLLAMVYILPPFQAPDEVAHYYRAIQISHGEVRPVPVASYRPAAGGLIEKSALRFAARYCLNPATWICNGGSRPGIAEILSVESTPVFDRQLAAFSNTVIYLPAAHLAPAVGIFVARSMGFGAPGWFYAGRLANALFSIAAIVLALRLLRGRSADLLVFVIATLPMTFTLLPTFSADAGVISCSLLVLAISVRLLHGDVGTLWLWPIMLVSVLCAAAAKLAYLPLALVPPACAYAGGVRSRALVGTLLIAAATMALTFLWSAQMHSYAVPIAGDPRVDIAGQIMFLKSHAVTGLEVLLSSMALEAPQALLMLVGWKLSGNSVFLPLPLLLPALLSLAVALAIGGSDRPRRALRAFVALVMLAAAISTFLFLYIQANKVGSGRVRLYQGRYLLPILPFAALVVPRLSLGGARGTRILRRAVIVISTAGCPALALFLALRTWH